MARRTSCGWTPRSSTPTSAWTTTRKAPRSTESAGRAMQFLLEVLIGGLLAGIMYSMVAIGFVLIFKASGVFNFAQGSMVLFAALTYVSLVERGLSAWVALPLTLAAMLLLGMAIERLVLRRLVNRSPMTLFMATLGLSVIIEGASQALWGAQVHGLELGVPDLPIELSGVFISQ